MMISHSASICSKRSRNRQRRLTIALLTSTALVAQPVFGNAAFAADNLPTGGQVVSGSVAIGTSGTSTTITQSSDKAIVNWSGFSIGAGNTVNFVQPNSTSAILNRVTGNATSTIAGTLTANGQVYLINPNGIAITSTGTVNVGGGFVASTLDISNEDFLKGQYNFKGNGASAGVNNEGVISVGRGGYAALIGGTVKNDGLIAVPVGKVGLGSGEQATLDLSGDGFLQVALPTKAGAEGTGALVENNGTISAESGMVVMRAATARDAARHAINLNGVVEANRVSGSDGEIVIGGGEGGSVEISGKVTATSTTGKGGKITVTGKSVALKGATVDASGAKGGGTVKIGGDYQGGGTTQRAEKVSIDASSTIRADATEAGNGGQVVVWSDQLTTFDGLITARGAGGVAGNGTGGNAEVSGKALLAYNGFTDLTGPGGFGTLLLDPYNLTISNVSSSGMSGFDANGDDSVLNVTTLTTALAGANVTVTTGSSGSQAGNITVATPISWSANTTLTLNAAGSVVINKDISATGASAGLVLAYGTGYSLNNGARVSLSGSAASLAINGQAYTLIHDVTALQSIGSSGFYALGNDIDASATASWNSGAGFSPIGISTFFSGTFAGLGHFIDSLTINRSFVGQQGLFGGTNGATLRDVTLSNISVNGYSRVGGLVAESNYSTLSNIHVTGSVSGYQETGGIAGVFLNSTLSGSSSTAAVASSISSAGGLVGYSIYDSVISQSYATGSVTTSSNAGGLVGLVDYGNPLTLTNVYASGKVSGTNDVGGLIGNASTDSVTLTNAYWDANSTGQTAAIGNSSGSTITGTPTNISGAPRTQSTYAGLDFTNTWVMIDGETRPMLRNEYSTVIATSTALQLMSLDLAGSYTLGANLNLTSAFTADSNGYYAGLWGASGFVPVGNSSSQFRGIFDGQGHTITGLTISRGTDYIGLFGYTDIADISDVALAGGSITGNSYVGSLVGYMSGGTVTDASASGNVTGLSSVIGGLVGQLFGGGSISRSYATGSVTGGSNLGGFVGRNSGTITQSYATGQVIGSTYIGGFAGFNQSNGTISNSYSTGSVTGAGAVGGFIGYNGGTITDAYASGRAVGIGTAYNIGGFAGFNTTNGTISNAYSTGSATGGAAVGGFVGWNGNTAASALTNVYWDSQSSGKSVGIGGGSGSATALTTAQLQGILPVGFSSSIWGTGTNLYPYFTWNYATTPTAVSGIAYSDAGTTVLAGATVTGVAGGAAIGSAVTGANGYYYILLAPGASVGSSGVMTYLDNGTINGAAISDVIGTNGVQNVSIYGSTAHVITDEATLTATWTNYLAARGSYADTDLSFLSSSSIAPLTTTSGYGVYLNTSGNYALNGNLGSSGLLTIDSGGTFGVSGTITLSAAGALTIADAVSWSDASSLTLSTTNGGNISLGSAVSGTSGSLIVSAGGTATTTSAINVGTFNLTGGTWSQEATTLPTFSAGNFVVGSSGTFLRATGGDGSTATPYQITDVYGLQGIASTSLLSENFVLAADIDASGTSNWNSGAGFATIGGDSGHYSGIFDGQNHTISGLTISRSATSDVGLFGAIGTSGSVHDLTISGSVTGGYAGLLAGENYGTISNVSSSGSVIAGASGRAIGGLVGLNSGTINGSTSSVTVDGNGLVMMLGGLAGRNSSASLITNSSATGSIIVSGTDSIAGGLVGSNNGTISGSFATGSVTNNNPIRTSVGGLVGSNYSTISNAYSTGAVIGGTWGGGFVGVNSSSGTISNAYSTGYVTSSSQVGGFAGINNNSAAGAITNAYWNTETSGQSVGIVTGSGGATGLTTAQMMDLSTFTAAGWSIDDAGGTASVWRIYDGYTAPVLRSFLSSLTVTGGSGTKTYDGSATSSATGTLSYSLSGYDTSLVAGTAVYTASSADAGNYTGSSLTLSGLYSSQLGYDITAVAGSLTINKAALTVTANNAVKTYDGLGYSGGNGVTYSGFVNGETASVLGGTLNYGGTSQGASAAGSYAITASGLTSGNYTISYAPGTLTISPANLTLTITPNAASKTYGQTLSLTGYSIAGTLIGSDAIGTVSLASGGTAAGAAAGSYDITASNAVFSSGSASNYAITYQVLTNGLTVNKTSLTVTANDASKTYDGLGYSGGNGVTYFGFVNGETSSVLGGTLSYGGTAQGSVNAGSYSISASGLTSGNYTISYQSGTLTVDAAHLTVAADAKTMYYGDAGPTLTYTLLSGSLYGSDALTGTLATAASSTANVGSYAITQGTLAASSNYLISYTGATVDVTPRPITVSASAQSMVYGDAVPALGYVVGGSGLVNGDSLTGSLVTAATSTSNVGTYAITQGSLAASTNYSLTYTGADLTVHAAKLSIIAANGSMTSGSTVPLLGYSVAGWKNDDTDALLSGVSVSTNATSTSAAGNGYITYAFGGSLSGPAAGNYWISYVSGSFAINAKPIAGGNAIASLLPNPYAALPLPMISPQSVVYGWSDEEISPTVNQSGATSLMTVENTKLQGTVCTNMDRGAGGCGYN